MFVEFGQASHITGLFDNLAHLSAVVGVPISAIELWNKPLPEGNNGLVPPELLRTLLIGARWHGVVLTDADLAPRLNIPTYLSSGSAKRLNQISTLNITRLNFDTFAAIDLNLSLEHVYSEKRKYEEMERESRVSRVMTMRDEHRLAKIRDQRITRKLQKEKIIPVGDD